MSRGIVDEIMEWADSLSPADLDTRLVGKFHSDLLLLERLFAEGIEPVFRTVESSPAILNIAKHIERLFAAIDSDGLLPPVKPGSSPFSLTTERAIARTQASEEVLRPDEWNETDYKKLLRGLCRSYETLYETLIAEKLGRLAGFIAGGKAPREKAQVLKCIAEYCKGKFAQLVEPFVPVIRNSIAHKDYIIDNKVPRITFRDRDKPTITLSVDQFRHLCACLLQWSVAFDYVVFKREEPMLKALILKMRKLQTFMAKSGLRLRDAQPGSSLVELADSIPDNK